MQNILPARFKGYTTTEFKKDLAAGCTVTLVLVPQAMANAQLAGLPAYHGLYAALLPTLIGALFGSSRHLVTTNVAITSIMASAALEPLVMTGTAGYVAYITLLSLMVGLVQLVLGLCRMGLLVSFLSTPVVSGFTNAAAIIIASSQLAKVFGVSVDSAGRQYETVVHVFESALNYTHVPSLLMALLAAGLLWVIGRRFPRLPAVLTAVVICTVVSWATGFERNTEADLNALASTEAKTLLARLNEDSGKLAAIGAELTELEKVKGKRRIEIMEARYNLEEKRLERVRAAEDVALVREHLRRMTFAGVPQKDGTLRFYALNSPDVAADYFFPPVPRGFSGEKTPPAHERPPEGAQTDGRIWRLRLGSGAPDMTRLHLTAGGEVVGRMPGGLPHFILPDLAPSHVVQLVPYALLIALLGFTEAVSIAKAAANRFGYRLDANRELVGQGLANIAGGFTQTPPVSGSFSVSSVNIASGAATSLSCVIASAGVLCTLFFLTGAMYYLPQPVLAVVVMKSVFRLVNPVEFKRVWTAQRHDGVIAVVTFCSTLFFAPHMDIGIGIGVVLSLASFFYRSMRPSVVALSSGPDKALREVKIFGLQECRHIALVHFQGALFFANASVLEDYIYERMETQKELRHIHLVCSGITYIDASGEEALAMLTAGIHKAGLELSFSEVVGSVAEVLDRTGLLKAVTWDNVFLTPGEAIRAVHARIVHDAHCADCPLAAAFPGKVAERGVCTRDS